jgi:NTE family protein
VTTRYAKTREEADRPSIVGYPPPAQVAGTLFNAIFLDQLDSDAMQLRLINALIEAHAEEKRQGLRPIDLLVLHPSQDLGRLANAYEADLPKGFRFFTRGLGTKETRSNDMLSLVMFQTDYVKKLIELGETDALAKRAEIEAFLK